MRVILVGAGHAHLHILKNASRFTERGHELVVVAPDVFWYSGLATGMLAGIYPPLLDQLDPVTVMRGAGRFFKDRAVSVDYRSRRLLLETGPSLSFDALSIDVGSEAPSIPGDTAPNVYAVKPIRRLCELRSAIGSRLANDGRTTLRIAVAGAGVTAFEIAACLAARVRECRGAAEIVILCGSEQPLADLPTGAATALLNAMRGLGIIVRTGARVIKFDQELVTLLGGSRQVFDLVVNATGLIPNRCLRTMGLPVNADGALLVDRQLQVHDTPGVFGGGDCVAFDGRSLPRVGVFAIRQAPVLLHNLLATLEGGPLRAFAPQKRFLSIMTLGNGNAMAMRGSWWFQGRLAFLLKDRLDRRFLHSFFADGAPAQVVSHGQDSRSA